MHDCIGRLHMNFSSYSRTPGQKHNPLPSVLCFPTWKCDRVLFNLNYTRVLSLQAAPFVFNRAALMNIGFLEALKQHDFDCFVFHDVDLLPLDTRLPYTCFRTPTHIGAYMSKFNYQ
jgi:hypothetical protein